MNASLIGPPPSRHRERATRVFSIGMAFLYASMLAVLPMDAFLDRLNYLNYADNSTSIFANYYAAGFLSTLSNEPLWLGVNAILGSILDADAVVRTIIFISSLAVAFVAIRRTKSIILAIVFLLIPQVIKNDIVHLRQGLAVAIFLLAWHSERQWLKFVLLAICPFIHASFFFVVTIYILSWHTERIRLSVGIKFGIIVAAGLMMGLAGQFLALVLGARQAEIYSAATLDVSGFSFVFWMGVLLLMILEGRAYLQAYAFEFAFLIFYLALYFISPLSGRIFEGVVLLVLVAGAHMTRWRRKTYVMCITAYGFMLYVMRMDLPWLGFGA